MGQARSATINVALPRDLITELPTLIRRYAASRSGIDERRLEDAARFFARVPPPKDKIVLVRGPVDSFEWILATHAVYIDAEFTRCLGQALVAYEDAVEEQRAKRERADREAVWKVEADALRAREAAGIE